MNCARKIFFSIPLLTALALFAACGGGGGSDPAPAAPAGDTTAPEWASGSPASGTTGSTSVQITAQVNEAATLYYILVADGSTAPSSAEVKAQTTYSGITIIKNGQQSLTANVAATVGITGLSASTAYDLYLVAEDTSANTQATPAKVDISTTAGGDTTPPSWSTNPAASGTTSTGTTLTVQLSEPGTVYWIVLADSATAPTAAQIKAHGVTNSGYGTISVGTANTNTTGDVTGLSAGTSYDIYLIAEDMDSNLQTDGTRRLVEITTISDDASLSNLTFAIKTKSVTNGTLGSITFASETENYSIAATNISVITVTPTKANTNATITSVKLNGGTAITPIGGAYDVTLDKAASGFNTTADTPNEIKILVTAQNGGTKTYVIDVNRVERITFYHRLPFFANNDPPHFVYSGNGVGHAYDAGNGRYTDVAKDDTGLDWNNAAQWAWVTCDVQDAAAQIYFQVKFWQGGAAKYLGRESSLSDWPYYTTTSGDIYIEGSSPDGWSGDNYYLSASKYTSARP